MLEGKKVSKEKFSRLLVHSLTVEIFSTFKTKAETNKARNNFPVQTKANYRTTLIALLTHSAVDVSKWSVEIICTHRVVIK